VFSVADDDDFLLISIFQMATKVFQEEFWDIIRGLLGGR
jgi:hypothetical protein